MSWTESEKLNEWIQRAYENGKREEQERIIKLLEEMKQACLSSTSQIGKKVWTLENAIALIKGENK